MTGYSLQKLLSFWHLSKNLENKIYKAVILPVVLYSYMVSYMKGGTWAKVIWKQDPEANVWTQEEWRRLHNEELHSLYRSPNIVRVIKNRKLRWAGHVVRMEKGRSAFKILTSKLKGKRILGRSKSRWEGNVRMNLKEISINTWNWVD
jgi:hypothetical protein